jgi:hypothetical protein
MRWKSTVSMLARSGVKFRDLQRPYERCEIGVEKDVRER